VDGPGTRRHGILPTGNIAEPRTAKARQRGVTHCCVVLGQADNTVPRATYIVRHDAGRGSCRAIVFTLHCTDGPADRLVTSIVT
jgi:hypothetical protein